MERQGVTAAFPIICASGFDVGGVGEVKPLRTLRCSQGTLLVGVRRDGASLEGRPRDAAGQQSGSRRLAGTQESKEKAELRAAFNKGGELLLT